MAERQRGMGRGLAAIISGSGRSFESQLQLIAPAKIVANPNQPRREFDQQKIQELADSLKERGLLQPVIVRPRPDDSFELIAGERRWRAAKVAELESIPALVRTEDDATTLEMALIENMAREDLNPVEEARACAALIEDLGLTREEVGRRVGRSRVAISNLIRLLELPDSVLGWISSGDLTEGHGRALLLVDDHDIRKRLAREAVAEDWSVRELERQARSAALGAGLSLRTNKPQEGTQQSADEAAALSQISEQVSQNLGLEFKAKARKDGYVIETSFASFQDLSAWVASLNS